MIINKFPVTPDHWTNHCIPISYSNILSQKQLENSTTFILDDTTNPFGLIALARGYFYHDKYLELGDVWLHPNYRSKYLGKRKISAIFLNHVICQIWNLHTNLNRISLYVAQDNIPAIRLYTNQGFKIIKDNLKCPKLQLNNAIYMVKDKHS